MIRVDPSIVAAWERQRAVELANDDFRHDRRGNLLRELEPDGRDPVPGNDIDDEDFPGLAWGIGAALALLIWIALLSVLAS